MKTVAFLSGIPGSPFPFEKWLLWLGIWEKAQKENVNLVYLAQDTTALSDTRFVEWLSSQKLDGLIIWDSFITYCYTVEQIVQQLKPFSHIPIAIIERQVPGTIPILADNRMGIDKLINHLQHEHGRKKIVYLTLPGRLVSSEREQFFLETMTFRGQELPNLTITMDDLRSGLAKPGEDFDGLIAHSDVGAARAMNVIKELYGQVPDTISICGFNDGWEARGYNPALTTVRLPFRQMGNAALAEVLKAHQSGRMGTRKPIIFPVSLIVRRSCGCLESMAEGAAGRMKNRRSYNEVLESASANTAIIDEMREAMAGIRMDDSRDWASELFALLYPAFINPVPLGRFTNYDDISRQVNRLMIEADQSGENISRWNEALSIFYSHLNLLDSPSTFRKNQALIQQLRVLLGQTALRLAVNREWRVTRNHRVLRDIESRFSTIIDLKELPEAILRGLRELELNDVDILLFENEKASPLEMIPYLSVRSGEVVENAGKNNRTFMLLDRANGEEIPRSVVVQLLSSQDSDLGLILYYLEPGLNSLGGEVLQTFTVQLSNALRAIRLRDELRSAQNQADQANKLKSYFLSTVSHELRTPLSLIVGLSEITLRNLHRGSARADGELERYVRQISLSGQHLDRLIRDVLDLASSQAGQMSLLRKEVDLRQELLEVAEMGDQMARQKGLRFRADIPGELPSIWGDKTRIRQILLNLLSNAAKFTTHGEMGISTEANANNVIIHVHDTGMGIPFEDQQIIFEEFAHSQTTDEQGYSGIGLGLAITKRLVQMHGGSITFTSPGIPGKGSVFSVTLPIWSHSPGQRADRHVDTRKQVLLLSSRAENGKLIKNRLRSSGFRVTSDLIDGFREYDFSRWESNPPGVILLDIEQDKESSWEMVRQIKLNPITQEVPVVFFAMQEDGERGNLVEINNLTKPIRHHQLNEMLERLGYGSNKSGRTSILVVDDEPGNLELHRNVIQDVLPTASVYAATDTNLAMNILRTRSVDLLMLDLVLRGSDSTALIHFLQSEDRYRNLPVIVLTSQSGFRLDLEKVAEEVKVFLGQADYSQADLVEKMDDILSRNTSLGSEGQRMVYKAVNYIHDHHHEHISRADIANQVNINEQYLSRCFTRELGISPIAYLNKYRIEMAKRILREGKVSVTRIARLVGYASQSYFSRAFQKEVGESPTAYQKHLR